MAISTARIIQTTYSIPLADLRTKLGMNPAEVVLSVGEYGDASGNPVVRIVTTREG